MNRTATTRRNSRGFTLVELCVAAGICAAVLGQAVPAMGQLRQSQALRAQAEALAGDLRLARGEAARNGESVFFRISGKGANACYVLHTGVKDGCDCAGGQAVCTAPGSAVIKAEWLTGANAPALRSNAETLEFQRHQGLVTQTGSIELSLENGAAIRQVIAITGRVRSCAAGTKIAGLPKCG